MKICVREYTENDIERMIEIWNEVVNEGNAFPQDTPLDKKSGKTFFNEQSFCGVAEAAADNTILGLYILHPNNVGRCGHISNASYAVAADSRGKGIGRLLVKHCIAVAKRLGFGVLQFNAVVKTNYSALKLYQDLGFTPLGEIPMGFRMKNGDYEAIIPHYILL